MDRIMDRTACSTAVGRDAMTPQIPHTKALLDGNGCPPCTRVPSAYHHERGIHRNLAEKKGS